MIQTATTLTNKINLTQVNLQTLHGATNSGNLPREILLTRSGFLKLHTSSCSLHVLLLLSVSSSIMMCLNQRLEFRIDKEPCFSSLLLWDLDRCKLLLWSFPLRDQCFWEKLTTICTAWVHTFGQKLPLSSLWPSSFQHFNYLLPILQLEWILISGTSSPFALWPAASCTMLLEESDTSLVLLSVTNKLLLSWHQFWSFLKCFLQDSLSIRTTFLNSYGLFNISQSSSTVSRPLC